MQNGNQKKEITITSRLIKIPSAHEDVSRLSKAVIFLLILIPIFSTIAYGAVETWAMGFLSLLIGTIAILWLVEAWRQSEFRLNTNLLQAAVAGLIFIGLIQLLPFRSFVEPDALLSAAPVRSFSLNPYATRLAVIQLIIYLVFLAAALVFINNSKRMRTTAVAIIIFGAIMAFFGILQSLANPEGIYGWRPTPQAAPFASFVNRHHFAALMEMTIGLTLALLVGKATVKDKRLLLIIALILQGIALILTGSRGGLLSLLGVVGFIVLTNFLQKRKELEELVSESDQQSSFLRKLSMVGSVLALILVVFGAVLFLGGDSWLRRGAGLTGQDDPSSGRLHFWSIALRVFSDYPILGAGLDSFGTVFTQYDSWNGSFRIEQAHNDYLQILADAGILGFVCVAAFIYLLFKQGLGIITREKSSFRRSIAVGALAGCFGILIHSGFDFPLRTPANAFFFLLLTVLATASVKFPTKHRIK